LFTTTIFTNKPTTLATPKPCGWTDVKIKQAWLNGAAALTATSGVLAGVAAITTSGPLALLMLPLFLTSGYCAKAAHALIDYEDAKVLTELRKKAQDQSLPQIAEQHGWDKLFRYEILNPTQFATLYRTHADALPFSQILSLYHRADQGLKAAIRQTALSSTEKEPFVIPSPTDWKTKFETETENTRCDEILNQYPLADLKTFHIVSPQQSSVLDDVVVAANNFSSKSAQLEDQFVKETPHQHATLQNAKDLAELTYKSHPSHLTLSNIDYEESLSITRLRSAYRSRIRDEERSSQNMEYALRTNHCPFESSCATDYKVERHKYQTQNAIALLKQERNDRIYQVERYAARSRVSAAAAKQFARELRDRTIAIAEESFQRDTQPMRTKIDAFHAESTADYETKIGSFEKTFRA
jgi:hypothetical protein